MGQYTEHWEQYRRDTNRRTLRLLLLLLLGLPLIAAAGYGLSLVTAWATPIQVALAILWLIALTRAAVAGSKVVCPRCAGTYARGRSVVNCPACGLRMFQDDP